MSDKSGINWTAEKHEAALRALRYVKQFLDETDSWGRQIHPSLRKIVDATLDLIEQDLCVREPPR